MMRQLEMRSLATRLPAALAALLTVVALGLIPAGWAQDQEEPEDAQPRRYIVEFIVFEYTEDVSVGTEVFPPEPVPGGFPGEFPGEFMNEAVPDLDETGADAVPEFTDRPGRSDAAPATDGEDIAAGAPLSRIDAVLLVDDERSMGRIHSQLRRLDVYRPLLYAGWEQDAQPKEGAEAIPLSFFGTPPAGLEGSLTLYLGRYLHLVVDLALEAEAADYSYEDLYRDPHADPEGRADPESRPPVQYGDERAGWFDDDARVPGRVAYRIVDDRILRNGEIRYFDHPKFGIIAKVRRVERADEAAPSDEPLPLISSAAD